MSNHHTGIFKIGFALISIGLIVGFVVGLVIGVSFGWSF